MPWVTSRLDIRRTGLIIAVVLLIVAIAMSIHLFGRTRSASTGSVPGLPKLALADLQGNPKNLIDYRGRPLFVNMWATWCPPCRAEIPDLERLYAANKKTGFTIVGVDQGQERAIVSSFVSDYGMTYPILLDPSQQLTSIVGTAGLPTTLVYDSEGKLVDMVSGMMSSELMRIELQKAVHE